MAKQHGTGSFMSIAEVAEHLNLSVSTVYNWRWRGYGPRSYKVGGAVRYRREDVDDWMERQATAEVEPQQKSA